MASIYDQWSKVNDPAERMERARTKLFENKSAQFWGALGLSMDLIDVAKEYLGKANLVSTRDVDTMATDAINIYYNPDYVMTLSEPECMGVIAHEISHCALRHFARQGDRDQNEWNIAADYELNLDLLKAGFTLPEQALVDWRFDGMAAEQIYNVVHRENEQARQEQEAQGQSQGQGAQQGQGEPDLPHKPASANMMAPSHEDGTPLDSEELADLNETWEKRVSQALGAARKAGLMAGGSVPTSLVSVTDHVRAHNLVDWRQPLRAFIDVLGSRQTTWAKFNRRALGRGQVLPGQKVIRPSVIGWFIDVSGSMDKTKNRQALVEAQAALDDKACDAIELVYVDTAIRGVDRYEIGDTIELKDATGGGTDFRSAMDYASEQEYAALVFVTDGECGRNWGSDPNCPVLWAITASQRDTDRLSPPFGDKLSLYTI